MEPRKEPAPGKTHPMRTAHSGDIPALRELFRSTVLTVNAKDYTREETEDWASCGDSTAHWERLLDSLHFVVTTDTDGRLTGFAAISPDGYLHSLFVHKDRQGEGIGSALLQEMEAHARKLRTGRITSEVSITARPFFERRGYKVERAQLARARKLEMTNYVMHKDL